MEITMHNTKVAEQHSLKTKEVEKENADASIPWFGQRHIQVFLMFVVLAIAFTTRISINVGIVAMLDNTTSSNPDIKTFNWTNSNVILSSFYWGYVSLQMVAAHFIKRHGVKWYMLGGMLVNTTVFLLIPTLAIYFDSSIPVIVCRVIQGLAQGIFLPSIHTALGKWAPVNERAKLCTFGLSGVVFGTVIGEFATGFIAATWAGWPAIFYVFGGFSLASCLIWALFAHNSPASHPSITKQEKDYIESSLQVIKHTTNKSSPIPWRAIFSSTPFWALFIGSFGGSWCNLTLLIETPTYLSNVMGFDITSNGFISAGPNILGWFVLFLYAFTSDYIIEKGYLTATNGRMAFQLFATVPSVILVVILGFLPKGQDDLCVIILFLYTLFQSGIGCGQVLNHLDLSPNYCGMLLAITNTLASATAIFGPLYVQLVVSDLTNVIQWRRVFLTGALISLIGGVIFALFSSAERQWWDREVDSEQDAQSRNRKISSLSAYELQFS